MAVKGFSSGSFSRFLVIFLFMAALYLLCTDYMYMTYDGSFDKIESCDIYKESSNGIEFNNAKNPNRNVIAGVLFRAKADSKQGEITVKADTDVSDNLYLYSRINRANNSSDASSNKNEGLSFQISDIKKGDEINLMLMDDSSLEYAVSGEFVFDSNLFTSVYVYNTGEQTVIAYSAFDLLFGSRSMDNMTFDGNITALIFWLPPIIALIAYIFDRKSYIKNLIGMGMSVISIFAVVYFIGGQRLAFGSMLSIILNLVLFLLCLFPILTRKNED